MTHLFVRSAGLLSLLCIAAVAIGEEPSATPESRESAAALDWQTDYAASMQQAKEQEKMLLIHFFDPARPREMERLERQIDSSAVLQDGLSSYLRLRLPIDARVKVEDKDVRLLDHAAFAEMEKHEGIAVIDYASVGSDHYGYVVTQLPFTDGKYYRYRPEHLATLVNLPPGTLTQRAMVFAVRIHPGVPASTKGDLDPHLMQEAKQHSKYQARIRVQGHHHWEHRFHRIARLLPFGLRAQEVVAESWPRESLMDAAVDCVHSWRQSPGHWGAVKRPQPRFAYDMERGGNGIWYATGIFGNRY